MTGAWCDADRGASISNGLERLNLIVGLHESLVESWSGSARRLTGTRASGPSHRGAMERYVICRMRTPSPHDHHREHGASLSRRRLGAASFPSIGRRREGAVMRTRFRLASAIAILAAILIAAPASATSPWTTIKQSGANAYAFNQECTENADGTVTCANQSIDVFEGTFRQSGEPVRRGEQVCYSEFTDTFDPTTGEGESSGVFGCTFDAGTLTVDDLTSITLAPTVIQLTAIECDSSGCTESPGGTTTVSGTWTGVGPIVTQKGRFKFDDGVCVQVQADKGTSRQASFEGSFVALEAAIGEGSFTFRTNCAF
jgi:hypothetical protein